MFDLPATATTPSHPTHTPPLPNTKEEYNTDKTT